MGEFIDPQDGKFIPFLLGSVACVVGVGIAQGATLGYLSLNVMKLKIQCGAGQHHILFLFGFILLSLWCTTGNHHSYTFPCVYYRYTRRKVISPNNTECYQRQTSFPFDFCFAGSLLLGDSTHLS